MVELRHVVCDHHQNRCETRQRHSARRWRKQEHDDEQCKCVDHSSDRAAAARANVRCSPRDRPGGRNSAENRRETIRNSLPDELPVRIMPIPALHIRHDTGEKTLDGAQNGDGECRPNHEQQR